VHGKRKLQRFANQCRSQVSYAQRANGNYCHHQHGRHKQHSSATKAVAATTSATTRRVSLSMRTRASSPDAYTVSMPITRMTSAMLICANERANNNKTCKQQPNKQKHSRHDMCTMRHARNNSWTSSKSSRLAEPVTPSSVTKKQAQATTTKNTILLVLQK
jgi:hypothetical protein